jgi:hypothetical protein
MLHDTFRRGRRAALPLALALAACERPDPSPPAPSADDPLSGVWSTRLVTTNPLVGHRIPPDTVRGTITLLRDDRRGQVPGLGGRPTHVGAHTLHLDAFGITLREDVVPGVAARLLPGDSVEIAFESARGDPLFAVRGHLVADSIIARWHYSDRSTGGAAGRALLRRTQ